MPLWCPQITLWPISGCGLGDVTQFQNFGSLNISQDNFIVVLVFVNEKEMLLTNIFVFINRKTLLTTTTAMRPPFNSLFLQYGSIFNQPACNIMNQ